LGPMGQLPPQDELIQSYVSRYDRRSTRDTSATALRHLVTWAGERNIHHIALLESSLFDLYARQMQSEYKLRTLAQKQGVIRRFYEWLVTAGVIPQSPIPDRWVPAQPSRATREPVLTMEQVEAMIPHATDGDGRALISLGGLDGLKLSQILQLTAADVSFEGGRAVVSYLRSDGRPHALPVCAQSAVILRELIDARPKGRLVLPRQLTQDNKRSASARRIATAARRVRMPIRVNSRTLEKSHRAALLARGATVHSVRERLGLAFSNPNYAETLLPAGADRRVAQLVAQTAHEMDALELLRQAESLCDQPGITPIAPIVLAGAALEMELRRMCLQRGLGANKDGIDAFATVLYRKGVITRFVHSTLQAQGKLRNEAAHGTRSPDLSISNARLMIQSVALFVGGIDEQSGDRD
jgi:integrase